MTLTTHDETVYVAAMRRWSPLTDEDIRAGVVLVRVREFGRGGHLLRAGDVARDVAVVVSGLLREHFPLADGSERTKASIADRQPGTVVSRAARGCNVGTDAAPVRFAPLRQPPRPLAAGWRRHSCAGGRARRVAPWTEASAVVRRDRLNPIAPPTQTPAARVTAAVFATRVAATTGPLASSARCALRSSTKNHRRLVGELPPDRWRVSSHGRTSQASSRRREKPKDAYDLYYMMRHYGPGLAVLAGEYAAMVNRGPLAERELATRASKWLGQHYDELKSPGPAELVRFVGARGDEADELRTDAWGLGRQFVRDVERAIA